MKVGDLVRSTHMLFYDYPAARWLVLKDGSDQPDLSGLYVFLVSVQTGAKGWVPKNILKVISSCQENVNSDPTSLQSDSERVTL